MTTQHETGKSISNDQEIAEKLWHLKRGFEVAFFVSFMVLIFGLVFHYTRHDMYMDVFLGSRAAAGGVDALRKVTDGSGSLVTGWLWWVVSYGVFRVGGLWAVSFLAAMLVTAGFAVLLAALRRSLNVVPAAALLLVAALIGRPYFFPGGQSAGVFLFGVLAVLLAGVIAADGRRFWLAPLLMILWVNLDVSWPVGAALCLFVIPVVAIYAADRKAEKVAALVVALGATLVNPDFLNVCEAIVRLPLESSAARIAPTGAAVAYGGIFVCVGVLVAVLADLAERRPAGVALALAGFLVGLFGGGRSAAMFPVVVLCIVTALALGLPGAVSWGGAHLRGRTGQIITGWFVPFVGVSRDEEPVGEKTDWTRLRKTYAIGAALAGVGLMAFLALFSYGGVRSSQYPFGAKADTERLPVAAVEFIQANGLRGAVLCPPQWAGYVLNRAYPHVSVFCDTRPLALTAGKVGLTVAAFGTRRGGEGVKDVLADAGVALAIVPQNWPAALSLRASWVPVYWDDTSAVFLPASDANAVFIAANDQTVTYPAYFEYGVRKDDVAGIISKLNARVEKEGPSAHVCYELGVCYRILDQKETAASYLLLALKVNPRLAMAYHILGDIVRGGNAVARDVTVRAFLGDAVLKPLLAPLAGAKEEDASDVLSVILYSQAVRYDNSLAMAYLRLGELYLKRGNLPRCLDSLFAARKADDAKPQLDRVKPGLRKELDDQIVKLTTPRRRVPETPQAATSTPAAATGGPSSSDTALGPTR